MHPFDEKIITHILDCLLEAVQAHFSTSLFLSTYQQTILSRSMQLSQNGETLVDMCEVVLAVDTFLFDNALAVWKADKPQRERESKQRKDKKRKRADGKRGSWKTSKALR